MELLQLVLNTTYFRGDIYQKNSGMAMGSPCSLIVANLFMEWLENEAITTAHTDIKPRIWKRYVDDIITIIPKDATQPLLQHFDDAINFTCEEMSLTDNSIPFLDTLVLVDGEGNINTKVFRKATHTNQYLDFNSHHPLQHKLSVIRTLYTDVTR
ncbi:uncharacterized protein [Antedon mediterranea]|uniref:uncharacterized protein n=1 Tax=Antedon mediterranea TaxID=105859 RepID=UPI003AF8C61C